METSIKKRAIGKLKLTKRALIRMLSQSFWRFHFSTWKIVQKAEKSKIKIKNIFKVSLTIIQISLIAGWFNIPVLPETLPGSTTAPKIVEAIPINKTINAWTPVKRSPTVLSASNFTGFKYLVQDHAAEAICGTKIQNKSNPTKSILVFLLREIFFILSKPKKDLI